MLIEEAKEERPVLASIASAKTNYSPKKKNRRRAIEKLLKN